MIKQNNRPSSGIFPLYVFYLLILFVLPSCYSFKGISIDPSVNTFYVGNFTNRTNNVVPTLSQTITETLKDKIRSESRLKFSDTDPDIEFSGSISQYRISSEAPTAGETTSFNRLTIGVSVEYINHKNEKENWKQTFSYFENYDSNENLLSIQDQLIESILDQIMEDIFNKAFTNW